MLTIISPCEHAWMLVSQRSLWLLMPSPCVCGVFCLFVLVCLFFFFIFLFQIHCLCVFCMFPFHFTIVIVFPRLCVSFFIPSDKMASSARGWRRRGRHLQMTNPAHAEGVSRYCHYSLIQSIQHFQFCCQTGSVNNETKPHTPYTKLK